MRLEITTFVIAVLATVSAIHAQLLCYQCDDCATSKPVIQPCGFVKSEKANTLYPPHLTPPTGFPQYPQNPWDPQYPQNPWDPQYPPNLTPPTGFPQYPQNPWDPQYPPNGNQGYPHLTPPVWPNTGGPWWNDGTTSYPNGLETTYWPGMSSTPWWNAGAPWGPSRQVNLEDSEVPAMDTDRGYACIMTKSAVNDRQLVRRGCTRLGPSTDKTCNGVVGSPDEHCELCTSHLCNTGS